MKSRFHVSNDISTAETISSDFYTEKDIFELSKEKIFSQSWQFICHKKELLKITQYPFTFLKNFIDEPLVITNQNKKIQCHSNVCTHRAHIVCLKKNNKSILHCRYHGRSFRLDGKMKNMPGFKGVKNFPSNNDNLYSIPIIFWKDFIFVSLNAGINIKPILNDIDVRLKGYAFDKLRLDVNQSQSYIIDSHWAIYCENYLEEFHIPYVHKGLTKDINLDNYNTILLENAVLQTAVCSNKQNAINLDKKALDSNKNMYAYYYWIFPNLMINFYAWGISINIIEPIKRQKTRIKYVVFTFPNYKMQNNNKSDLKTVELEDQNVVESVQKGINSSFYKNGRYSTNYETGVHHFHKLITKYL